MSQVESSSSGTVRLLPGDELFLDAKVQFIKIDVEGHETQVLRGLRRTIDTLKPTLYVETRGDTTRELPDYLQQLGYNIVFDYFRYEGVVNFMFAPAGN